MPNEHRIIVRLAAQPEQPYLERLMIPYLYDMTVFVDTPSRELEYEYPDIERYWQDSNRYPFFIEYDTMRIGFALITEHEQHTVMSEFFIPRHFRRHGIGTEAAWLVFDRFPGRWRVAEMAANRGAQRFWRRVIDEYTDGSYEEAEEEGWNGPVQYFQA
jgi:predicted acetyltransferase